MSSLKIVKLRMSSLKIVKLLLVFLLAIPCIIKNPLKPFLEEEGVKKGLHTQTQTQFLHLDSTAALFASVEYIQYDAENSQFRVQMKPNANCSTPYLLGRLSGPALLVMDWTWNNNVAIGNYHAPVIGRYFVEVVALYCYDFSQGINISSSSTDNGYDFTQTCAQDPFTHRLTAKGQAVDVVRAFPNFGFGSWRIDEPPKEPVLTRWQPDGCRKFNDLPAHCTAMKRTGQETYTWKFHDDSLTVDSLPKQPNVHICFVGKSHSRVLTHTSTAALNLTGLGIVGTVRHIEVPYPELLSQGLVTGRNMTACTHIIVGFGQWSMGLVTKGHPRLFLQYFRQVYGALALLQNALPDAIVLVRSVHHSGLMDYLLACHPRDWRAAPVVDGYNQVTKQAARMLNMTFIDTIDVVKPMWDSALDLQHLDPQAAIPDALYILAVALGVVDPVPMDQVAGSVVV